MWKKPIYIIFLLILLNISVLGDNRYNEDMNLPQNLGGQGNISEQTGALSLNITDLKLPGLNQLEFIVKRSYSTVTSNIYNMAVSESGENITTLHTPLDWKYGLGCGWSFNWPFIMKDLDGLNTEKKINLFWDGAVYELENSFDSAKEANNIKYYEVNDKRICLDSSVVYPDDQADPVAGSLNNLGVTSRYCLELKEGIKYYFSEAGNLMVIKKPADDGNGTIHYTEIWFYYKAHSVMQSVDDYEKYRQNAKIEMVKDSVGRLIDFVYQSDNENWLTEIRYPVTIAGVETMRSVSYQHQNISLQDLYRINSETGQLEPINLKLPAADKKFILSGFINPMGHLVKYEYTVFEARFSFNSKNGNTVNFFAGLTTVFENYTHTGTEKYKNKNCYEYNNLNSSYQQYRKSFTDGFMDIFKVTREYAVNKTGEIFNDTVYEYYGNSYGKQVDDYWTIKTAGGLKTKSVYSAKNIAEEKNLLKYVEITGNKGTYLERTDYVYDVRKTLKSKTLFRSSIEKYKEEFIYDLYNDLTYHKAPNGLETQTTFHPVYHVPVYTRKKNVEKGDGTLFDVESRTELRETDGKVLYETLYLAEATPVNKRSVRMKAFQYDCYGNPIEEKDALGQITRTVYDPLYHLFPVTVEKQVIVNNQSVMLKAFKLFNSDATVWIEADYDGYAVEHMYDELGTEIKTILPDNDDLTSINTLADLESSAWKTSRINNTYIEKDIDYQEESIITYSESYHGKRTKKGTISDGLSHILKEIIYENEASPVEYAVKAMDYDSQGNLIALTDPDADRTKQPVKKYVGGKWVETYNQTWLIWYDDLKRKIRVEYPDEGIKSVQKKITYNDLNYKVTTVNTRGNVQIDCYDVSGNLIRVIFQGITTEKNTKQDLMYQFVYNKLNQKIAVIDPENERVSYVFDERGLITKLDYGNTSELMTYDDNGNLLVKIDQNQDRIKYYYDEMNRNIRQEHYRASSLETYHDYLISEYDRRGNVTQSISNQVKEERNYDARSRVVHLTYTFLDPVLCTELINHNDWLTANNIDNQKFTFTFHYTSNNLLESLVQPNGKVIQYQYDEDKLRLSGIKAVIDGELTSVITGLTYNRANQVTDLAYENGTRQHWMFDLRKRIHTITVDNNSDKLMEMKYQVDTENNITAINHNCFVYDEMDRLIQSEILHLDQTDYRAKVNAAFGTSIIEPVVNNRIFDHEADLNNDGTINAFDHIKACQDWKDQYDRETYNYNLNGNRSKLIKNGSEYSYAYGIRNQLLTIKKAGRIEQDFSYDANGNLIRKNKYNNDDSVTQYEYRYDNNNRLLEVWKDHQKISQYIYDHNGLRLFKGEVGSHTYYFRNGQTVNYEIQINQATPDITENNYIIAAELIAGRISRKNQETETVCYYHLDHLNSTKLITDQQGNIILNYEYCAFGTELDKKGTDPNRFSFINREKDETGFYYLNARYYDPDLGRFFNIDPIKDGYNWYLYAGNNPLKFKDPTGLTFEPGLYNQDMATKMLNNNRQNQMLDQTVSNSMKSFKDIVGSVTKNIDFHANIDRVKDSSAVIKAKENWNKALDKINEFKSKLETIGNKITKGMDKVLSGMTNNKSQGLMSKMNNLQTKMSEKMSSFMFGK